MSITDDPNKLKYNPGEFPTPNTMNKEDRLDAIPDAPKAEPVVAPLVPTAIPTVAITAPEPAKQPTAIPAVAAFPVANLQPQQAPAPQAKPLESRHKAFELPAYGELTAGFGVRKDPFGVNGEREVHGGYDVAMPIGTPVSSVANGRVKEIGYDQSSAQHPKLGFGNYIIIETEVQPYTDQKGHTHPKQIIDTRYGHLKEIPKKIDVDGKSKKFEVGLAIKQGQKFALSGSSGHSTGGHLHLGFYEGGMPIDLVKRHPELVSVPTSLAALQGHRGPTQIAEASPAIIAQAPAAQAPRHPAPPQVQPASYRMAAKVMYRCTLRTSSILETCQRRLLTNILNRRQLKLLTRSCLDKKQPRPITQLVRRLSLFPHLGK